MRPSLLNLHSHVCLPEPLKLGICSLPEGCRPTRSSAFTPSPTHGARRLLEPFDEQVLRMPVDIGVNRAEHAVPEVMKELGRLK